MWKVYRGHSLKGCRNHSPLAEPRSPGSKKLVKSHLPEELWELHLWRCQTGKSNNLWPPEPFSLPRSVSITLWHPEIIKNGQNLLQFNSPTCNRSLSSTCFSFLSPERENRKNPPQNIESKKLTEGKKKSQHIVMRLEINHTHKFTRIKLQDQVIYVCLKRLPNSFC